MKTILRALAILCFGLGVGLIVFRNSFRKIPPTPTWQEEMRTLSQIEQATMSADFSEEFTQMLSDREQPQGTPTPIVFLDVPASMAGDLTPPRASLTYNPPCFALWVSDNMTPWQQLVTRSRLDNAAWSTWTSQFSYCFPHLQSGTHTARFQLKDLAGNVSSEYKQVFVTPK